MSGIGDTMCEECVLANGLEICPNKLQKIDLDLKHLYLEMWSLLMFVNIVYTFLFMYKSGRRINTTQRGRNRIDVTWNRRESALAI